MGKIWNAEKELGHFILLASKFKSNLRNIHAYTYVIVNDQNEPIDVTFDCTNSKNMLFTSKYGIVQKAIIIFDIIASRTWVIRIYYAFIGFTFSR